MPATCRWPRPSRARRSTSPSSARRSRRSRSSASSSLEDDLDTQPAENIAPIVRDDYLAKVDAAAFAALLDAASAKMTTEELTRLGVLVAVDQKDIEDVAKEWLTQQGLIQ